MNAHEPGQDTIKQPHGNFATPDEVVVDPALSKQEKSETLDAMEQDARLLAMASAEGMSGGEPTNLHEVLDAKEALKEQPTDSERLSRNEIGTVEEQAGSGIWRSHNPGA